MIKHILVLVVCCFLQSGCIQAVERDDIIKDVVETGTYLKPEDFLDLDEFEEEEDITTVVKSAGLLNEEKARKNPTTRANLFEGDIKGHTKESIHTFMSDSNYMGRNAIRFKLKLWPDGRVPYLFSSQYGDYARKVIASAMVDYHKKTCIRFVPRTSESNYIYIHQTDGGCYSHVGRVGIGRQSVSLDAGCIQNGKLIRLPCRQQDSYFSKILFSVALKATWETSVKLHCCLEGNMKGIIIHELMHSIGFFHEQSRADRDDYITVVEDNMKPSHYEDNFQKYTLLTITHLGAEYDYGSIMHYGPYDFSKDTSSLKTIIRKRPGSDTMGQRNGFSKTDIYKINKLYQCENVGEETDGCRDTTWNCFIRPTLGRCHSYNARTKCKKTCGHCDTDGSWLATGRSSGSCKDSKDHCADWAEKGHCDRYGSYMRKNCPKSCNFCDDNIDTHNGTNTINTRDETVNDEKDDEIETDVGKQWGASPRTIPPHMIPDPPTSQRNNNETETTVEECIDKDSHCTIWTAISRRICTKYPTSMRKKCRRSCGFCTAIPGNTDERTDADILEADDNPQNNAGDCKDVKRKCTSYANKGFCTGVNKHVMQRYCKKSCHLC